MALKRMQRFLFVRCETQKYNFLEQKVGNIRLIIREMSMMLYIDILILKGVLFCLSRHLKQTGLSRS